MADSSESSFDLPDVKRDALRSLIATIEGELARLDRPIPDGGTVDPLKHAWAKLLEQLAIGPAPESRACPKCGRLSRVAATRCAYCWASLKPPTP